MDVYKSWAVLLIVLLVSFIGLTGWLLYADQSREIIPEVLPSPTPTLAPTSTPFVTYSVPDLPRKEAYTIILVGDSILKSLGPNSDRLREYLAEYYPETVFGIFSYGYGSTNISTLMDRLTGDTFNDDGQQLQGILNRQSDVIVIESFGYNPLSDMSLEVGLALQEDILTKAVTIIADTHPETVVVFMTPIAPNEDTFGLNSRDLSPETRREWVEERRAYIENHRDFAREHGIPLIDVYAVSQDEDGNGLPQYIDPNDYIHPSAAGVELMASEMAKYWYEEGIIPLE